MKVLGINGGRVEQRDGLKLVLPPVDQDYSDAQVDDYHGRRRKHFLWNPGSELSLAARFSHPTGELVGTAGFGFWNAPFGDPSYRWPALPKAVWFFYASEQSDLPLALDQPGHGWFVSTIDSTGAEAIMLAPIAPFLIILNNIPRLKKSIWPFIRERLEISFKELDLDLTDWHSYRLRWKDGACEFWVDERSVFMTHFSPKGPLGFVCWIDNQYLVAKPTGAFRWGTLPIESEQWLEIAALAVSG